MRNLYLKKAFVIIAAAIGTIEGYGQSDSISAGAYDGLSLKNLLNLKIVSVSKQTEFLFDTPLSASVITKEDIRRAGCTSIMEAMRLAPGVIVRQQNNGNYDIHIRGMDNVPPNASFDVAATTTLVMIDGRPIYSYLRGGTFWETLPVDLNDVEKIEVVRGPAAALYGPNAVNGVINIITRTAKRQGLYIVANTQQGSHHSFINNASIGFKAKKWAVIASGNYQGRDRSQTSYFEFNRNTWIDQPEYFINFNDDTTRNIDQRYPDQSLAMKKYAGNIFLNYNISDKIKFDVNAGIQHSRVQKVSAENGHTPFSTAESDTRYAAFRASIKGLIAQFSINGGQQNVDFDPGNKYDFRTIDANIEYNYEKGNFSLKPGLSYRSALYDDTRYSDIINKKGIFNARAEIITKIFSLRAEYKLLKNRLRFVAGFSINKFNYPDTNYTAYQFAATYKINKNQLFRAVYSKAPRSSNIYDTYVDQTVAYFPSGFRQFTRFSLLGNKNLKLLTADMFELGYRARITPQLSIDVELFNIYGKNPNILINSKPTFHTEGINTVVENALLATNLPLEFQQRGATISLAYTSRGLEIKPFITFQQSKIKNYAPYHNTVDAGMGPNHIYSGIGTEIKHSATPTIFGGAFLNYLLFPRFNVNLSAYYYSGQTYTHLSHILFNDGIRGIDHIDAKLILNASISYEADKRLHIFFSGKNLLNDESREFFRTDAVPLMLLGGINYEF